MVGWWGGRRGNPVEWPERFSWIEVLFLPRAGGTLCLCCGKRRRPNVVLAFLDLKGEMPTWRRRRRWRASCTMWTAWQRILTTARPSFLLALRTRCSCAPWRPTRPMSRSVCLCLSCLWFLGKRPSSSARLSSASPFSRNTPHPHPPDWRQEPSSATTTPSSSCLSKHSHVTSASTRLGTGTFRRSGGGGGNGPPI